MPSPAATAICEPEAETGKVVAVWLPAAKQLTAGCAPGATDRPAGSESANEKPFLAPRSSSLVT